MGIYDRDYYRREGPGLLDALWPSGTACKWLISINVVVYLLQLLTQDNPAAVTGLLDLEANAVMHGEVWRLLTYAFLHAPGNFWHIFWNMLFLWWFGSDVEQIYGPREFLAFYLTSACAGGVLFFLWALSQGGGACLGASAAVTAVLVLCACHFPNRSILVFMILPVPIWIFVIFNVAQDAFHFFGGFHTSTAVAAHLGGALFGFVYYRLHWRITPLFTRFKGLHWPRRQERLRLYRPETDESREPVSVAVPSAGPSTEHFEAKLDAVLEKIARHGRDSLSDDERRILQQASEMYKKRRT